MQCNQDQQGSLIVTDKVPQRQNEKYIMDHCQDLSNDSIQYWSISNQSFIGLYHR